MQNTGFKILFIYIMAGVSAVNVFSKQNEHTLLFDSLKAALKKCVHDTERAKILNELAEKLPINRSA